MHEIIEKYCSPEWQKFIEFHSQTLTYPTNSTIFKIGDPTEGLYLINEGRVKILTKGANNTERIIRLAADGDILGHRGFGGTWTYSISAITLTPCTVTFISIDLFNQIVMANPKLGFFMMMFFAEELRASERLAKRMPVKNLVASVLNQCYNSFGFAEGSKTLLSYTLSRKDIASKAGTTYESVVRSMSDLARDGVIELDGKLVHIINLEALKELSEGR